jgi:competence protein ComEA
LAAALGGPSLLGMRVPILSSLSLASALAPRRRLLLALALSPILVASVLVGVLVYTAHPSPAPAPPGAPAAGAAPGGAAGAGNAAAGTSLPPPSGLLVEVTGAVAHPGVYRVAKGDRASAAIAAAGGLTADADPNRLPPMAARLKDGQQVKVPALGSPASTTSSSRVARVSLNAATEAQLATVPGFTPGLATAVIAYRTQYGGFASTRELVDVLQMSVTDYALARKYVTT